MILNWKLKTTGKLFITPQLAKIILTIGFGFLSFFLNAQKSNTFDSLTHLLKSKDLSDSATFEVLEELAKSRFIQPSERLQYATQLLTKAEENRSSNWIYKAYLIIGHTHKKLGDLEKALKNYLLALEQAQLLKDLRRQALIHTSIASVYRVNENYERAFNVYNKAISLLRATGDQKNLAVTLMNTGELYRIRQVYDSALLYFKESSIIFDSINYEIGKAYNLGNIGLVYAEQKQYNSANKYLSEAISILTNQGEFYPIIVYNLSMADIYISQNQIKLALELVEENLAIAIHTGLKEQIKDANLKLSELYLIQDNYEQAYYHQNQYLIYRDSINNEETIRKMADLRANYEISQKQIEVDLLEEQQKRQNVIFLGLMVIILLLCTLVYLFYRNFKRKQALNMIITERKEEAEAQRDQLSSINETKEKFLSIISHDLLGPVNSFKGLSTIMKASIEAKDLNDLKKIHQIFDQSVNNLSSLLTNLLDWSVTQQGAIPYEPKSIIVADTVNELLSLFSNMAATKDIQLQSTLANKATVWADENSLKTILRNLVSNSIKFTDGAGTVTISSLLTNQYLEIRVTDSGIGMPQEKIELLLSADNFKHSAGTKGEEGVGLGLQLVKEFTEANKGKMRIESEEGKGTTISIFLPIAAD